MPTEKESATTTKIELDVPAGSSIDSFEPAPGWKRQVAARGLRRDAVVQKVTWTGGSVPTEEDAVFQFLGQRRRRRKTTRSHVRQTYSDGSVVDWSGPESSDTPAPTVEAKSLARRRRQRSTLAIVALVVGGARARRSRSLALVARPGRRTLA